MRFTIIILLLITSQPSLGQNNWSIKSDIKFDRYIIYKGIIDSKYPFTMYLEKSGKTYNGEYNRWTPKMLYGWYMYDKVGKKIPLVGHFCNADACESYIKIYVPNDPVNYTFDDNCALIDAKEIFTQDKDMAPYGMEWQLNGGERLPVRLETKHKFKWTTKASLVLMINNIEIKTFNLSYLTQNELIENINILAKRKVGNSFHLILEFSHQSNPGSYGYGMCGAGVEKYLSYLKINNTFDIEKIETIQTYSCIESKEIEVDYNQNHPEQGITVIEQQ